MRSKPSSSNTAPLLVGIAGGTGSGKSTVVQRIIAAMGPAGVVCLDQDSYYRDNSHIPLDGRRQINFDHPDSLDFVLLLQHMRTLRAGEAIEKPVYSFTQSVRLKQTTRIPPAPVIVVEGILVLAIPELRDHLDIKIFVDAEDDVRLIRRIERDTDQRGRSLHSVLEQYQRTVRPMHLTFVEPSKRYADVIIPRGGHNDVAINMVIATLRERLTLLAQAEPGDLLAAEAL